MTTTEWFCPLCHATTDDIVLIDKDIYRYDYICYDCSFKLSPPVPHRDAVPPEED